MYFRLLSMIKEQPIVMGIFLTPLEISASIIAHSKMPKALEKCHLGF